MTTMTLDGKVYNIDDLSENAKVQLNNLEFVNQQILQRNNELQVAETAKMGYTRALKRELEKVSV